jgi:hypothetical protein
LIRGASAQTVVSKAAGNGGLLQLKEAPCHFRINHVVAGDYIELASDGGRSSMWPVTWTIVIGAG